VENIKLTLVFTSMTKKIIFVETSKIA